MSVGEFRWVGLWVEDLWVGVFVWGGLVGYGMLWCEVLVWVVVSLVRWGRVLLSLVCEMVVGWACLACGLVSGLCGGMMNGGVWVFCRSLCRTWWGYRLLSVLGLCWWFVVCGCCIVFRDVLVGCCNRESL